MGKKELSENEFENDKDADKVSDPLDLDSDLEKRGYFRPVNQSSTDGKPTNPRSQARTQRKGRSSPAVSSEATEPSGSFEDGQLASGVSPSSSADTFIENLIKREYHPVIIVGGPGAGKTVLIASILYYLNRPDEGRGVTTSFDPEPLFPAELGGDERHAEARRFYEETLTAFSKRKMPERTSFSKPFFIPITITPSPETGGAPVKLAFLESRGEFYDLNRDKRKSFFKTTVEEIKILYEKFDRDIQILFVAAGHFDGIGVSETESQREERGDRDDAMYALLQSYMAERGNRFEKLNGRLDPSVFVLTKWDMRFLRSEQEPLLVNGTEINQIALSPVFLNPSRDYLEAVISGRYPRAWAEYCVPRRLRGEDQLTAYSAGVLAGEPLQKLKVPDELRGQLEYGLEYKSAKELVDKLYKNIKGYTLTDGPTAPPPSGFKRLLREMFG